MSDTQLYSRKANGVTYSDPARPSFTVRMKTSSSPKTLDGLRTNNIVTEIIVNDKVTITKDGATSDDPISVRVRISGSQLSHDALKYVLKGLAPQLTAWSDQNVVLGFEPTTVPTSYVSDEGVPINQ